ncbi:hypothetical protein [Rhizobium leguminosarum]|uniref:hypothetical protein n=1 Tax=Rhizobium leguminosarum TaxID=384 RepID=UPI0021BBC204|nr:hypothetical protein [Rhizobium leguminosarum]
MVESRNDLLRHLGRNSSFRQWHLVQEHLRPHALTLRVEVADGEVPIMGSKTRLLQALIGKCKHKLNAHSGTEGAEQEGFEIIKWRPNFLENRVIIPAAAVQRANAASYNSRPIYPSPEIR